MERSMIADLPENFRRGMRTLPEGFRIVGWGRQINETHHAGQRMPNIYRSLISSDGDVLFVKKPKSHAFDDDVLYAAHKDHALNRHEFYKYDEVEIEAAGLRRLLSSVLDHVISSPCAPLSRIRAANDLKIHIELKNPLHS